MCRELTLPPELEILKNEIAPEQMENIKATLMRIGQELTKIFRKVKEALAKQFNGLMDALLHSLNKTKWWHLYKYSKKRRVRKKYRDKLMRLLLSEMRAINKAREAIA